MTDVCRARLCSIVGSPTDKGIDALKSFIAECSSVGGAFVVQAKAALESNLYEQSARCISTSYATNFCVATYLEEAPNGPRAFELRSAAENAANSPRCKPFSPGALPAPPPTKQPFCILANGQRVCE